MSGLTSPLRTYTIRALWLEWLRSIGNTRKQRIKVLTARSSTAFRRWARWTLTLTPWCAQAPVRSTCKSPTSSRLLSPFSMKVLKCGKPSQATKQPTHLSKSDRQVNSDLTSLKWKAWRAMLRRCKTQPQCQWLAVISAKMTSAWPNSVEQIDPKKCPLSKEARRLLEVRRQISFSRQLISSRDLLPSSSLAAGSRTGWRTQPVLITKVSSSTSTICPKSDYSTYPSSLVTSTNSSPQATVVLASALLQAQAAIRTGIILNKAAISTCSTRLRPLTSTWMRKSRNTRLQLISWRALSDHRKLLSFTRSKKESTVFTNHCSQSSSSRHRAFNPTRWGMHTPNRPPLRTGLSLVSASSRMRWSSRRSSSSPNKKSSHSLSRTSKIKLNCSWATGNGQTRSQNKPKSPTRSRWLEVQWASTTQTWWMRATTLPREPTMMLIWSSSRLIGLLSFKTVEIASLRRLMKSWADQWVHQWMQTLTPSTRQTKNS